MAPEPSTVAPDLTGAEAQFGPNAWLVAEMRERYLADPASVDHRWAAYFAASPAAATHPSPASLAATPPPPAAPPPAAPPPAASGDVHVLRGAAARTAANMTTSLSLPTATSVRTIPANLLVENRTFLNNHLARARGGKVSFTHIIAWAIVRALRDNPAMNAAYAEVDGRAAVSVNAHINLGLAIDLPRPDGSRSLLVPCIRNAENMDFRAFWSAYDTLVSHARAGTLTPGDFIGTTVTVTNPGTIGTMHSVPRLMSGQGLIVGVGAMEYPAEWQGAAPEMRARAGVGRTLTVTSTYDHRIIQGAQSGEFLRRVNDLLLGADEFYIDLFSSLRVPYRPYLWAQDIATEHDADLPKVARVQELIHAYRVRGHLIADTNPLSFEQRSQADLIMANHALTIWDLDREFATGGFGGRPFLRLREIVDLLRTAYAGSIGVEYMHIQDPVQRAWIQERVERPPQRLTESAQQRILRRVRMAESFERLLHTKYVGQKRFSLEGSETAMVSLDTILSEAAADGLAEVCLAMPHRGRLNVLVNIVGKSYAQVFREFEDVVTEGAVQGSGDVKYHLGSQGVFNAEDGASVPVYLAANPSHLEAVDPVLEGIVRAKQDLLGRDHGFRVLPVLIHGDAAFAGQGVVTETLHLSQLRGYRTGGTVHLIINNQVGFTTTPESSRSSVYASDAARIVQAPIFHVNGDDPEAVVRASALAYQFRCTFHKDVVIELVTYRRRGHNEADDPSLTQPRMYAAIDAMPSVGDLHSQALIGRGDMSADQAAAIAKETADHLAQVFAAAHSPPAEPVEPAESTLAGSAPFTWSLDTRIPRATLDAVIATQAGLPADFNVHPRLAPQLARRAAMATEDAIDWAMAETIAIGSLLAEGRTVRLAGQDCRRGTFGQRHAVIFDAQSGRGFKPLKRLARDGARYFVYDSLLSEFAGLGFEYGYSVAWPQALVMWEAQFGDFANGAQTIIDEFIASGEHKWCQTSGVVLLLPHGMEGQGPDHSSARIERFLALAAADNMTIAQPSQAANYCHLLRWQALGSHHRPLVVFTPKSMLRSRAAASPVHAFTEGGFTPVIVDPPADPAATRLILLATGKLTHELVAARTARGRDDVAVIRVERLYPLPLAEIRAALANLPAAPLRWVQEEPANQGAYPFMAVELAGELDRPLERVARPSSPSPAVGSHHRHDVEHAALLAAAFA